MRKLITWLALAGAVSFSALASQADAGTWYCYACNSHWAGGGGILTSGYSNKRGNEAYVVQPTNAYMDIWQNNANGDVFASYTGWNYVRWGVAGQPYYSRDNCRMQAGYSGAGYCNHYTD